jgi:hypothetical protein
MFRYASVLAAAAALFVADVSFAKGGRGGAGRSSMGRSSHRMSPMKPGTPSGRITLTDGATIRPGKVAGGHRHYGRGYYGHHRFYGHGYRGWSYRHYSPYWRYNFYYSRHGKGWFYWYAPKARYYPVSMLETMPPDESESEPEVNVPQAEGDNIPQLPKKKPVR